MKTFYMLILILLPFVSHAVTMQEAVGKLTNEEYSEKESAIQEIFNLRDVKGAVVLDALLTDSLYFEPNSKQVIIVTQSGDTYSFIDAISSQKLNGINIESLEMIRINNKMRKNLKIYTAVLNIKSNSIEKRTESAKYLLANMTDESLEIVKDALKHEKDKKISSILQDGLNIWNSTNSDNESVRIDAINKLGSSINPEAKNALSNIISNESESKTVLTAAGSALKSIKAKLQLYSLVEMGFFGLSLGSVLLLSAIGLAITFGVMGIINMAHGEMMMIGAYCTYVVQKLMPNHIEISIVIAIPVAFIITGLVGIIIERSIIRFLYGRPLETLLATFGLSLILQQTVRSIFSPLNKEVVAPSWMSGSIEINPALSLTYNRIIILIFAFFLFLSIIWIIKKTSWGLQIRAVSQNRPMAQAIGIKSERVNALTFGIGSGIAGIAGVALSQLTNVGPNMGQAYIIDSFMVVVFGGVGNLWGTFIGAFTLGEINKFLEPLAGAVLAKVAILIFIVMFIQKKPRGLFPQKGREVEG